ncbi:NPC intracellular cholesterol transporter 2-like [Brevipalpus obovatus]|uniref:NPC intracellular cholesterol transporter 2-like n=1 Tax=Brevipalpus obovatus TaxID=246614 RepID=UPI003D9F0988
MLAKAIILVIFGTSLVLAGHPKFTACDSGVPAPSDVQITDCEGNSCVFDKTKSYNLTVNFIAPVDATDAKLDIKAKIGPVVLPWPGQPTNICNNFVPCPMKSGEKYVYQADFAHLSSYPSVSGTVIYRLNDGDGNAMFCFKLKFKLE